MKNLQSFFKTIFVSRDKQCEGFKTIFLKPDGKLTDPQLFSNEQLVAGTDLGSPISATPARFKDSRLQSLFNELPNQFNKAFVGMAKNINQVKEFMFTPGCIDIQKPAPGVTKADVDKNLNYWNDL